MAGLIRRWVRAIKRKADALKIELHAMALAFTDRRTPWYVKVLLVALFLYAASPIDLIPDFIPVLGMIDDIIIISLGLALAVRLIPKEVMTECRERAREAQKDGLIAWLFRHDKG